MIKNYFLIAVRNFWKHKVFSIINIAGLAIGISAALVIYLLVKYEFSFDTFHKDKERIYQVVSRLDFPDQQIHNGGVCAPLPDAVQKELTGIESSAPFHLFDSDVKVVPVISGSEKVDPVFKKQDNIIFANGDYFNLVQYKWIAGTPGTSLSEPFKVVLTANRAAIYFPGKALTSIPGNTITYNDSITATVSGIVANLEETTDFTFQEFISRSTIPATGLKDNMGWEEWGSVNSNSLFLVKLSKGMTTSQIEKQLASLRTKYGKDDYMITVNLLQPLEAMHFSGDYDSIAKRVAHKPTLYGLLAVAAFLLLLGCINFINLTTAQAALRAKEIGIRKTMGSSRAHLIGQFLGETFFLTLLATLVSICIAPLILKMFSDFMPPELKFSLIDQQGVLSFILLLMFVVTIISGFYPAMVLSKFKPVDVIKSQSQVYGGRTRKAIIRRSLTVSQFVVAQFFIIATMLVGKQIQFALNKDMGFRRDAIVNFNAPWNAPDISKRTVLLNKLQAIPGVAIVSLSGSAPAALGYSSSTMKFNDGKKDIETTVGVKSADSTYFNIYNMKLVAGTFPLPNDSIVTGYLVNETYARFLGFAKADEVVGKIIDRGEKKIPITGVLKDFHDKSVHTAIKPLVYSNVKNNYYTYHILLKAGEKDNMLWKDAIARMESSWKQVYPEFDFKYAFFDETIESFYKAEQNISRLLMWATGLAIFISCLGMLGLVIYTTSQRAKEIGVRKVLGASVSQIVSMLSKDYMQLVLLAFIIAAPLAWWASLRWLADFAYRTPVSWWIFMAGGFVMIFIALFTLSIQTIRAAIANPVKSLRTE